MDIISAAAINRLTKSQRDLLIMHIDGPFELSPETRHLIPARVALLARRMILGIPHGTIRPRHTALSDAGKQAICAILGEAADHLVRAGLLAQDDPLYVIERLTSFRRDPPPSAQNS